MKKDIRVRIKLDDDRIKYLLEDIEELNQKLSMIQYKLREVIETAGVELINDWWNLLYDLWSVS